MSGDDVPPALRIGVIAGAAGLGVALFVLRFCGDVPMPPRPPPPTVTAVDSSATLAAATASEAAWRSFVDQDARAAGVPVPTDEQLRAKLVYRTDESPRTVAPGADPIEAAGLRVTVLAIDDPDGPGELMVLSLENLTEHDLAYRVVASPRPGGAACNDRTPLWHDAMVIRRRGKVERSECGYRAGMTLHIEKIETVEVEGLQSVYLSRVPPIAIGGDPFDSKTHRPRLPAGVLVCNLVPSQVLRSAIGDGSVRWRDLVDFYARHRCDSYHFPLSYRAFERQGERPLPAEGD